MVTGQHQLAHHLIHIFDALNVFDGGYLLPEIRQVGGFRRGAEVVSQTCDNLIGRVLQRGKEGFPVFSLLRISAVLGLCFFQRIVSQPLANGILIEVITGIGVDIDVG